MDHLDHLYLTLPPVHAMVAYGRFVIRVLPEDRSGGYLFAAVENS